MSARKQIRGSHKIMNTSTLRKGSILALAALGCLSLVLAGCSGDDGAAGPPGAPGPVGPPGGPGPDAPGATVGVVIGTGALTAAQAEEIGVLQAEILAVSVSSPPTITFKVTAADGRPALQIAPNLFAFTLSKLRPAAAGRPSSWVSYINRVETAAGTTSPNVLPQAVQANTESGAAGTMVELGGGQYRYTYATNPANVTAPVAVAYEPTLVHRVGFEIRGPGGSLLREIAPANPVMDFIPATGATVPTAKNIATTASCNACHDKLAFHGGPRQSVEYCVTCHNPDTIDQDTGVSLDMAHMAHAIHLGSLRSIPYVVYGFGDSRHDYGDVTYPQDVLWCESCHTATAATPDGNDFNATVTPLACGGCHVDGLVASAPNAVTGKPAYAYQHDQLLPNNPIVEGQCLSCHFDGSSIVGPNTLAIHAVQPSGNANWGRRTTELGRSNFIYEILGASDFVAGAAPKVTFRVRKPAGGNWTLAELQNMTVGVMFDTNEIINAGPNGAMMAAAGNGRPLTITPNSTNSVLNEDGSYTVSFTATLPAYVTSNVTFYIYGRQTVGGLFANPDAALYHAGAQRVEIVTQEKCDACHGQVFFHGGGRAAGDPLACASCHNSNYAKTAQDGAGGALGLAMMIHELHAGNRPRTADLTYPQPLQNCLACHAEGTFNAAKPAAWPVSVVRNNAATWADDIAHSATGAACLGCHTDSAARAHMEVSGAVFFGVKGAMAIPSSQTEACVLCHGPGRIADTAAVHGQL
jgi:OmcA/MtrC family decaheme c-type cytochrome